ncbi:hypothetical protein ACIA8O_15535 [Kitasatospora sp. NPDC051853]
MENVDHTVEALEMLPGEEAGGLGDPCTYTCLFSCYSTNQPCQYTSIVD